MTQEKNLEYIENYFSIFCVRVHWQQYGETGEWFSMAFSANGHKEHWLIAI